jgi:hypothetical protein
MFAYLFKKSSCESDDDLARSKHVAGAEKCRDLVV